MAGADPVLSVVAEQLLTALVKEAQHAHDFKNEFDFMKQRVDGIKKLLDNEDNCNQLIIQRFPTFREFEDEVHDILTDCSLREEYQKHGPLSKLFPTNFFFKRGTCKKIKDINLRMKMTLEILGNSLQVQQFASSLQKNVTCKFGWEHERPEQIIIGLDRDAEKIKKWILCKDKEVAYAIQVDELRVHEPKFLNEKDSWSLFCSHASLEDHCRKFRKAGAENRSQVWGTSTGDQRIGVLLGSSFHIDNWNESWINLCKPNITKENKVTTSLHLSYKALPPYLRQCLLFLYLPEEIQAEKLIHWWVGEEFIQGKDSKTAIEMGFESLSKLVSTCLVEVVHRQDSDERVYKYKLHDLVRGLIIQIAKVKKLCSFDEEGNQNFDKDSRARWLGFRSGMDAKLLKGSPKLRALLMTSNRAPFHRNLGSLRSLRALDLSNNTLDNNQLMNLFSWISSIKRLAYLNLSGAKQLQEVPHSICKLRNLQLLILRGQYAIQTKSFNHLSEKVDSNGPILL
ncbi:hypothetical protein GH714_027628 [Hevea brasiliensis]|uniref:Disease resistance protein winged helix domain-containing protein n=1 Tax=Hevea brasiliensis TaxID=3981 RepID=A0A6A6MPS7_HEVBR|nr:hypothetical protein GH714_027628 [Hevea brasiliensis]